jgi:hypothetical protein
MTRACLCLAGFVDEGSEWQELGDGETDLTAANAHSIIFHSTKTKTLPSADGLLFNSHPIKAHPYLKKHNKNNSPPPPTGTTLA